MAEANRGCEPADKERGPDVVGQVRDDAGGLRAREDLAGLEFERIRLDNIEPAG
jgi:hypothetical protein